MGLFTLTSSNPKFSFIINKNPATIKDSATPYERSVRKGRLYGWFLNDDQSFRLYFQDSPTQSSYSPQEFEYLDKTRYCSPEMIRNVLSIALNTCMKHVHESDVPGDAGVLYSTKAEFTVDVPYRIVTRIVATMSDNVGVEGITENGPYKLTVIGDTVNSVLNLVDIICVLAILADDDIYLTLNKDAIKSHLRTLVRAKVPYYVWHLYVSRSITNRDVLNFCKEELDASGYTFAFGNTQVQRADCIKANLLNSEKKPMSKILMDIGCGELFHTFKLSNYYDEVYAFDADPEIHAINCRKVKARGLEGTVTPLNVAVTAETVAENTGLYESTDVLLTEVLEHIEKPEAAKLLTALLATEANNVLITVPNKDFNTYYGLEATEMRHNDHKWEPGDREFAEFVAACHWPNKGKWKIQTGCIGDIVDGHSPSLFASFQKESI